MAAFLSPDVNYLAKSAEKLSQQKSNIHPIRNMRSRRSFSPYRNALTVLSPDISPIARVVSSVDVFKSFIGQDSKLSPRQNDALSHDFNKLHTNIPNIGKSLNNLTDTDYDGMFLRKSSSNIELSKGGVYDKKHNTSFLNNRLSIENVLVTYKLKHYIPLFEQEEIDFDVFVTMDSEQFASIGVQKGDIEKLLSIVRMFTVSLETK